MLNTLLKRKKNKFKSLRVKEFIEFSFLGLILVSIFFIKVFSAEDINLILKDITDINKIPAHNGIKEVKYIKDKKTYIYKSEI